MSKLLYKNLKYLCQENNSFYCKEEKFNGKNFEIFNYRHSVEYKDFTYPDALECRGHTFEVDNNGNYIRTAAWPFEKFFNLFENPLTQNIKHSDIESIYPKEDGSLIMSYLINDTLFLKTKGCMNSEQSQQAIKFLENNKAYYESVNGVTYLGYTVLFEWCSYSFSGSFRIPRSDFCLINVLWGLRFCVFAPV